MKRADILRRLEERLARGEVSEKTYLEIKARYVAEPEEPEREEAPGAHAEHAGHAGYPEDLGLLIERTIRESVEPALRNMPDLERRIRESVEPATAGMRFSDFGEGVQSRDGYVKIAGSGVVTGNPVRAHEFKSAGSGRVVGDLEADVAKSAGSCVFEGNVTAQEFHTAGSVRVGGRLRGAEVHSSGTLSVGGDIQAREVHVRGSMEVGGRTTAEEFHLSGGGKFGGPLESREIQIELGGDVSAPAIHGTEVLVRRPGGFFRGRCELRTERIAAREVSIECTIADLVVGEEVVIGPHCRIGVVEARDLTVHESSEVKERRALTHRPESYQAGRAGSAGAPPPQAPAAPPAPPAPPSPPAAQD